MKSATGSHTGTGTWLLQRATALVLALALLGLALYFLTALPLDFAELAGAVRAPGMSTRSFDGRGNYSMGVTDQTVFPEIELDKIKRQQGMDITIVTSARTDEEALEFLKLMGLPFAERTSAPKADKAAAPAAARAINRV